MKEKDGIAKDVSCILERANEQTGNTYINMWTHLETQNMYAWRLTPTDPTPKGKQEKPSLRELEQQIRRDIEDGIDSTGKKMTLCQLYAKQNAQRANVKKSTQKQQGTAHAVIERGQVGCQEH